MKLLLVTGNQNKLNEWRRLLPDYIELESADIDLPEIQSMDPAQIVADKAKRAFKITKQPLIVEDVSAGLDSLGGLPGPFIKFFIEKLGQDALYKLAGKDGGKAKAACTVAFYNGTEMLIFKGEVNGTIVEARGENGFGFDKGFIPDGQTKTYGQMTHQEKDKVSHRARAAKRLIVHLQKSSQ